MVVVVVFAKSCPTPPTQWTVARQAPLSMDFAGKNAGVGSHFLLQRIISTQGLSSPLYLRGFPGGASGKEPACQHRRHYIFIYSSSV